MSGAIPITVLTGFLGSGKTTVLNHLVHQPELARSLVIINEFGEVGLDHMLVTHSAEDGVVEMSSGCLCCTIRKDLVQTLKDITWRFSIRGERLFDRVLIETTGLADPAPILNTLIGDESVTQHYRLDGVVSTVDAVNGLPTIDSQVEAGRQVAVADTVLLTKSDLCKPDQTCELRSRLAQLNPGAPVINVTNGKVDPSQLLALGSYDPSSKHADVERWIGGADASDEHHHHQHDVNRHSDAIRADSYELTVNLSSTRLQDWVTELTEQFGSRLLRFKAVVPVNDQSEPVVVHAVQHVVHTFGTVAISSAEEQSARLVIITDGVSASEVEQRVDMLCENRK